MSDNPMLSARWQPSTGEMGVWTIHERSEAPPYPCERNIAERCESCGTRGRAFDRPGRARGWHHLVEHRHTADGCWAALWFPHTADECRFRQTVVEACRTPGPLFIDWNGEPCPEVAA